MTPRILVTGHADVVASHLVLYLSPMLCRPTGRDTFGGLSASALLLLLFFLGYEFLCFALFNIVSTFQFFATFILTWQKKKECTKPCNFLLVTHLYMPRSPGHCSHSSLSFSVQSCIVACVHPLPSIEVMASLTDPRVSPHSFLFGFSTLVVGGAVTSPCFRHCNVTSVST